MSTDELLKRLRAVMQEWPAGSIAWHRACGRRGVIAGHVILGNGDVTLRMDYGNGGWGCEVPASMSGTKISDGTDGDEWKDGKEGAGV